VAELAVGLVVVQALAKRHVLGVGHIERCEKRYHRGDARYELAIFGATRVLQRRACCKGVFASTATILIAFTSCCSPVRNLSDGAGQRRLFLLAAFHAYVIFGLACLSRVILRTGLLLIAALCAARLLSPYWVVGAAKTKQHQNSDRYGSHDGAPLNALGRPSGMISTSKD
jgi:hypothetical protein